MWKGSLMGGEEESFMQGSGWQALRSSGSRGEGVLVISLLLTNQMTELKGRNLIMTEVFRDLSTSGRGRHYENGSIHGSVRKVTEYLDWNQKWIYLPGLPPVTCFSKLSKQCQHPGSKCSTQKVAGELCLWTTAGATCLRAKMHKENRILESIVHWRTHPRPLRSSFLCEETFIFQVELSSGLLITAKSIRIFYINFASKAIEVHWISVIYPGPIARGKLILPQDFIYCTVLTLAARGSILHNFYNHCYYLSVLFRDKVFSCFFFFSLHLRSTYRHAMKDDHTTALPASCPTFPLASHQSHGPR